MLYPRFESGPKRHKPDLEAIRNLRNVYVHGRSLTLPLALKPDQRIDTDGTKMKQAVDRLIQAKVIGHAAMRTTNNDTLGGDDVELLNLLYSVPAVLRFVGVGRAFQAELYELWPFSPEVAAMTLFPDLGSLTPQE